MVNFVDDTTTFLGDITCFIWMQVILKLHEDVSSAKINFSKSQASAKYPLKIQPSPSYRNKPIVVDV